MAKTLHDTKRLGRSTISAPTRSACDALSRRELVSASAVGRPVSLPAVKLQASGAGAWGAWAVGAIAVGALAIGALAISRLAIKRLSIRRSHIGNLQIDHLLVRRMEVEDNGYRPLTHTKDALG